MMTQQKALKRSKKIWAASLLLCLGFILSAQTAKAEDTHHMVYEVYAGGIHAVQAKVDFNFGDHKNRYSAFAEAKTRGFLGALVPWYGTFESRGWVEKDGHYSPEIHRSVATWKEETQTKDYEYNRDGTFKGLTITEQDEKPETKKIEKDVTDGTIDAFTAAMEVMNAIAAGQECNGSSEVFDGKRRFEQKFVHEKYEDLTANKYNIYSGKAAVCTIEVVPVAGEWSKKPRGWLSIQEQGRERGTMPTVWMGKMSENGPVVPIKIRVKTEYGTLFMHLAEYKNGSDFMVAEKRVTEDD